jgi:hypothetical protein
MSNVIRVRCNGPEKHINEVDLNLAMLKTVIIRGQPTFEPSAIPKRLVLSCRYCTTGKVVLTRDMIEGAQRGALL